MIGRGNHNGVNAVLPQQLVVIDVALGAGRIGKRLLDVGLVNIAHRYALGAELLKILAQIAAAPAGPDYAICQPVIRAPCRARHEHRGGCQERFLEEIAAIVFHEGPLFALYYNAKTPAFFRLLLGRQGSAWNRKGCAGSRFVILEFDVQAL